MYLFLVLLLSLCGVSQGRLAFVLPDRAETLLSAPLDTSFSCQDKIYGYYADMANNCEVFHVCLPIADDTGTVVESAQFTFVCGNTTVFSQDNLTCMHREDALPCEESAQLYDLVNSEFGVIPDIQN